MDRFTVGRNSIKQRREKLIQFPLWAGAAHRHSAKIRRGSAKRTANRLRNWVEGPARSEQSIGPGRAMEMSRGSMSLRMQPRVRETNFATPWKGGGIGRARGNCFLPRHLWSAETYDWHTTWGCARNLAQSVLSVSISNHPRLSEDASPQCQSFEESCLRSSRTNAKRLGLR